MYAAVQMSSALSQLLNLHNLSEEVSQAQHERAVRMGEVRALFEHCSTVLGKKCRSVNVWLCCMIHN